MGTDTPSPVTPPKKAHSTSNLDPDSHDVSQTALGDTPATHKSAPHKSGGEYSVEASRSAVLEDMGGKKGAIPEVEYEFFQAHILPPLHNSINIDRLVRQLERDKLIVNGRWSEFPVDPFTYAKGSSEDEEQNENYVFGRLVSLVDDVTSNSRTSVRTTRAVNYISKPDSVPICCFDEKYGRPDGYFVLSTAARDASRHYWRDLATPAEFKLRDRRKDLQSVSNAFRCVAFGETELTFVPPSACALIQDINQIAWDMYQIMREDPRRRFVFGFTIENTQMRIWMINRSEVVVSQPFNFITDHKKFLHFFLSQAYAPLHRLGLDTSMVMYKEMPSGASVYDITVHDTSGDVMKPIVFRTTALLNDDGARAPLGRGTRIWRVKRLIDGVLDEQSEGRVLKDSWIDEDRMREGKILEQITDESHTMPEGLKKESLTNLFLTPIASGDVLIEGHHDSTHSPITVTADIPETTPFPLSVLEHKSSHTYARSSSVRQSGSHSITPATDEQRLLILKYLIKRHYRIVYKEECQPLSNQTSLGAVFDCLYDVTLGVAALHDIGWVHRDISTGNMLYDQERKRWVLSDLEYAKRLDANTVHDIRTGTANFIAVEVDEGRYMFGASAQQDPATESTKSAPTVDDIFAQYAPRKNNDLAEKHVSPVTQVAESQIFHYNPVHDLESLWWIALYFVINKETRPATSQPTAAGSSEPSTITHPNHEDHTPSSSHADTPPQPGSNVPPDAETRFDCPRSLFYDGRARLAALRDTNNTALNGHLKWLPKHIFEIAQRLILLRNTLCRHYKKIEGPGNDVDELARTEKEIYMAFLGTFQDIRKLLENRDIIVSSLPPDPNESGLLHGPLNNLTRGSTHDKLRRHKVGGEPKAKKQKTSSLGASRRSERLVNKLSGTKGNRQDKGKGKAA